MKSFSSGATYSRQHFRFVCAIWITSCRRPFRIVNDTPFQDIVGMLNPLAQIHSEHTQANDVKLLYKLSRQKITSLLERTVGVVHLELDAWTDIKMTPWLGIVIYIISNGHYKRFTLDFIRLRGSHTGSYLAEVVNECLIKHKLQKRVSNNNNAFF